MLESLHKQAFKLERDGRRPVTTAVEDGEVG